MKAIDMHATVARAVQHKRERFPHTFIDGLVASNQQEVVDLLADAATILDKDRRANNKNLAKRIETLLGVLNNSAPVTEAQDDTTVSGIFSANDSTHA